MWSTLEPASDALFLDIDGTLLDIAAHPQDVIVPPSLKEDLQELYDKLQGALALISGRSLQNIDQLLRRCNYRRLALMVPNGGLPVTALLEKARPYPNFCVKKVYSAFAPYKGLYIEDKAYSIAIHYRQAPDLANIVETTLDELLSETNEITAMLDGKKVFEIVRPEHNKGRAVERFMATPTFKNRRPIFLGDDKTDLSAMSTCLRYNGIVARVGQHETEPENPFPLPQNVRSWLHQQTKAS